MGALLGILGLAVFFIFMIISLINIFRKKPKKKTVIIMMMGLIFFIVGITMDGGTEEKLNESVNVEVDVKEQAVQMTAEEYFKKGNEFFAENKKESYEKAYECYKKAVELEPSNIEYLKQTAFHSKMLGRYEEAIEFQKKVIKIKPDDVDTYSSLAGNYSDLGNYNESLKYYDRAIELDSNNHLHYFGKAMVLNKLGNYSEALNFYQSAYKLDEKSFKEWVDLRLSKVILDNSESDKFIKLEDAIEFLMFSDYVFKLDNIGFNVLQKPSADHPKYEIRVYKGNEDEPEAVYFFSINAHNGNIKVGY